MDIGSIQIILSLTALTLSLVSLIIGTLALARVIGIEKSTHSVQMVPIDPTIDKENEAFMKSWATKDESIKKENEMYKEDVEDNLNQFSNTPDEKEIFSL